MATALYRRYRPESFAEVIGQDHVTTPLRRALRNGRIGHAYLFSGPRGCGKTTSARILARCLNCAEGPTDTPCGTCDSCRDLARGGSGSLDVVEIDAASHGGVDDARELRERASFAPVRDRFKVFIIDEAHMVTSAGFNALLKLVEEPPDHVKFVFATTEPDKVIGTIRSRTHHYPFRLIPPQVLGPYLQEVCAAEDVRVGEGVLPLVVRAGGGSARDTMSVLDQLMAGAGDDGLDQRTAIALLGFTDTALLDQAVTAVSARDAAGLYDAVEQVLATGHEPRRFVEDLLERLRDLIILAAVPDRGADLLPQVPADELEAMRTQAEGFVPADLSRCGDLVHETLSTMSGATSPRLHLELLAARLVLRDARAGAAPTGSDAAAGAPAPSGGGGREEARRIAQERGAARRSREEGAAGGGRSSVPTGGSAPEGSGPRTGQQPRPDAPPRTDQQARPAQQTSGASDTPPVGADPRPAAADGRPAAAEGRDVGSAAPVRERAAASWGDSAPARPARAEPAGTVGPGSASAPGPDPAEASAAAPAAGDGGSSGAATSGGGADAVREHWSAVLDELSQIRRPSWALVAQNAHVQDLRGSTLLLGFRTEGLVSAFRRGTAAQNVADAVRRIVRIDVTVEAVVGEDPGPGSAPGASGPRSSGPGGPSAPGGDGPRGPGAPDGPRGTGGPAADGPGTGPAAGSGGPGGRGGPAPERRAWGDMAPGRTAPRGPGSASAPVPSDDDLPPEPDDPYPPDPQDDPWEPRDAAPAPSGRPARPAAGWDAPASAGPGSAAPAEARPVPAPSPKPAASGRAEPDPEGVRATGGHPGTASPAEVTADAPTTAGPAAAPLEVEDEGRDSVPEGEPRTAGQAAIRRAIAEGRVVRSLPARRAADGPGAGSDAGTGRGDGGSTPAEVPDPGSPHLDVSAPGPSPLAATPSAPSPLDPVTTSADAQVADAGGPDSWDRGPEETSAAEPRSGAGSTSWEPARAPGAAADAAAPATARDAAAPASEASPSAPGEPRRGIALAREAAQASRGTVRRGPAPRPGAPDAPAPDADPTGGASRDDEDAVVATRSGREVIETVLGGRVLEVIDETGEPRR